MKIKGALSHKILNSNSNFTIEVIVETEDGRFRGSSPAGESVSQYEISQFQGDLDREISAFNEFLEGLKNKHIETIQDLFDFEKKIPERFVGGPSISLSYALTYSLSASLKLEPYELFGTKNNVLPVCKMLGGGMHASGMSMDIQEILVTTLGEDIMQSVAGTLKVYHELKDTLKQRAAGFIGGVDPEGGFITNLDNYESLKLVQSVVEGVIKKTALDIRIGIDAAASTFFKDKKYHYRKPLYGKGDVTRDEQIDIMVKLAEEFDLYYLEDPVDENFPEGYKQIKDRLKCLVIGDDLTATKTERLEKLHDCINSTLIKPNQVGLLGNVMEYSKLADKYKLTKVVSHRSEETTIPIISDLAVGLGAKYLKIGINRGERIEKINRLIELN